MGRKYRNDGVGVWHHVMNRGIARRTVFETRADVRFFLSRIAHAVRREELELHVFCVMSTHFHLLVRSPHGLLATAMCRIQNDYVRYFNRGRRRDGPLFRGRFTSKPVESLTYRELLVQYIDNNPVSAGLAPVPALFSHGSAYHYARRKGPRWLSRQWVEQLVATRSDKPSFDPHDYSAAITGSAVRDLEALVERRIRTSRLEDDPFDELISSSGPQVISWMRHKAQLADGTRPAAPVCAPSAIAEV